MTDGPKDAPNELTRRRLLALGGASTALVAGAAVLGAGPVLAATADPIKVGPDPTVPQVPRRVLGKTGKEIPILLLGGGDGFDARFDPRLVEALRFGANYIDAADCYAGGTCEDSLGRFHERMKNRDQLWITSKSDRHDPAGFEITLMESLKKLRTDHVEMYFLHALKDEDALSPELEKTVERLKGEGKILHFGFSCHDGNVAKLLERAARTPWVEAVMFRYSFHQYGDAKLNAAIDAAHDAGVGLIAMKTQGSEAKRDAWKAFEQNGKWTKHQAVLKSVWTDQRLAAAVSHMTSVEMLRQNIAAAVDRSELASIERDALARYAAATRSVACDGCDHLCSPAVAGDVRIADTMRYVMYHDVYGQPDLARALFAKLPPAARALDAVDFAPANRACPNGVDVAAFMKRAATVLS